MKKRLTLALLLVFLFCFNLFGAKLSPQAEAVLKKFENFFKGRGINVKILIDKEIPDKNIKLPGYRFITMKLWKGKREQILSFLTNGVYMIRDIEIVGKPSNLIEDFQTQFLTYNVPVKKNEIVYGKPNAKVKIIIFGDFECPFCKRALRFILNKYKNNKDVVIYFKHYPLPFHRYAKLLASFYEAGKKVGVNLIDFLETVKYKRGAKPSEVKKEILSKVKPLIPSGKWNQFVKELNNKEIQKKIKENIQEGNQLGVRATPTIFINGKKVVGLKINLIQKLIEEQLKKK